MTGFRGSPDEVWRASQSWWAEHGMALEGRPPSTADAAWSPDDTVVAFPGLGTQRSLAEGLRGLGEYAAPAEIPEGIPEDGGRPDEAYFLVVDGMPEWSRGLTAPALRRSLAAHERVGLTVAEYLVLQRLSFEQHGDHRFDSYTGDTTGWTWLPAASAGGLHAMAYYLPAKDRVEVSSCKAGSANPRKGAHVARVVPVR